MLDIIELLRQPWSWYFSGFMIAVVMYLLLKAGGEFGVSSTLRTICSASGAGEKCRFFDFDWKSQWWNIVFVIGAIVGGFIATEFLNAGGAVNISKDTIKSLSAIGVEYSNAYVPQDIFSLENLMSFQGITVMVLGGFLVGFGARYAGGCTSGHAISGISDLQLPSFLAVIGFFIGGTLMTYFILPFITQL